MKFSNKDIFRKCDQIRRKLQIWSNLLKKSLMENFFFCAVKYVSSLDFLNQYIFLVDNYIIPVCQDGISTRPGRTDFIPRLHGEIKLHPGKAVQLTTWYLLRFVHMFFSVLIHLVEIHRSCFSRSVHFLQCPFFKTKR